MVHLGGLTPPASQAKRAATCRDGQSGAVREFRLRVRVTALAEAIARLERRTSACFSTVLRKRTSSRWQRLSCDFEPLPFSAEGLAATVENDAVILETLL